MSIPRGTHVILATYVGEDPHLHRQKAAHGYADVYAGRLVETFAFERGAVIGIDGPLGGVIPTREAELTAILAGGRTVGAEFFLPHPRLASERVRHVLMAEPYREPRPTPDIITWPAHLELARSKAAILALALHDREVYDLYKDR